MKKNLLNFLFLFIVASIIITGCERKKDITEKYRYSVPEKTTDGWETGSLDEVGLSEEMICRMMDTINSYTDHRILNFLIVKDDKIVFEEYFEGHSQFQLPEGWYGETYPTSRYSLQHEFSMTKGVTSTLIGIAIEKGFINSVSDKVIDYLPEFSDVINGGRENITIENLLTMTSGLDWNESDFEYGTMENDATHFTVSLDPLRFFFSKSLIHTPGTFWEYNGGGTDILGYIIEKASGMTYTDFAEYYVFHPLRIYEYSLDRYINNLYSAMGGLSMSPRDFLKIGNLYLNDGKFNSASIMDPGWIKDATTPVMFSTWWDGYSYGYQWWSRDFIVNGKTFSAFFSLGLANQRMWVFPEQKMIVFYNCEWINFDYTANPGSMMIKYILSTL